MCIFTAKVSQFKSKKFGKNVSIGQTLLKVTIVCTLVYGRCAPLDTFFINEKQKLHLATFNVFFSRLGKKGALFFSGKNDISKSRQKVNFTTKMPKLYKKQSYFVLQKVH